MIFLFLTIVLLIISLGWLDESGFYLLIGYKNVRDIVDFVKWIKYDDIDIII